jgi:hypothetical protein
MSKSAPGPLALVLVFVSLFHKLSFPCQGSYERAKARFSLVEEYHQGLPLFPRRNIPRLRYLVQADALFYPPFEGCVFSHTGDGKKDTGDPKFLGASENYCE